MKEVRKFDDDELAEKYADEVFEVARSIGAGYADAYVLKEIASRVLESAQIF